MPVLVSRGREGDREFSAVVASAAVEMFIAVVYSIGFIPSFKYILDLCNFGLLLNDPAAFFDNYSNHLVSYLPLINSLLQQL